MLHTQRAGEGMVIEKMADTKVDYRYKKFPSQKARRIHRIFGKQW
jgi:hypothetical protein